MNRALMFVMALCAVAGECLAGVKYMAASKARVPAPPREFRAVWVASVANIDWPSRQGLSSADQRRELVAIFDRAVQMRMNAIILQVRPACDALYQSSYEPWSEYLTGKMGQAPVPFYDPLQFAVTEAHRRGLELHAWFNPFRARHSGSRTRAAQGHVTHTEPEWVRRYDGGYWLDPGDRRVQEHGLKVILDVVRRYDIDGVHLDDYFYPYPARTKAGRVIDFPDDATWRAYVKAGGKLERNFWRRNNVDGFVYSLYRAIKREKPWVKVGISPFGIWRPGHPAQVKGLDAYDSLYADARRWLREGWLDYCAPQLYWTIGARGQSFPALLEWWAAQNVKSRHMWPGISVNHVGAERPVSEIVAQVAVARRQAGVDGQIFWSIKALRENRGGLARRLVDEHYQQQALVPASPWLDHILPPPPTVRFTRTKTVNLTWTSQSREVVRSWVIQTRNHNQWSTRIIPGLANEVALPSELPEVISIAAVDRVGNVGVPLVLEKRTE